MSGQPQRTDEKMDERTSAGEERATIAETYQRGYAGKDGVATREETDAEFRARIARGDERTPGLGENPLIEDEAPAAAADAYPYTGLGPSGCGQPLPNYASGHQTPSAPPLPPAMSVAEAKQRMAAGYSTGARQLASQYLAKVLGPGSPLAPLVSEETILAMREELASVMLGVREHAIEECAKNLEELEAAIAPDGVLLDGPHKGKHPRVRTYSSMLRGLTMTSLVGTTKPETH